MDQPKHILIVDDEQANRDLLEAMVESLGHVPELARRIRQDPEVCDIPIIMQTALTGKEDRLRAVEAGATDFIAKPVDKTELRVRATSLLRMKAAQDVVKRHQKELEETVQKRTAALRQALAEMADSQRREHHAHLDTIHRLAVAAEYKDEDTAAHIDRMSRYSALLARHLKLPPGEVELFITNLEEVIGIQQEYRDDKQR